MTVSETHAVFVETKPHFNIFRSKWPGVYGIVSGLHFERLLRMDFAEVEALEAAGWYEELDALVPAIEGDGDETELAAKLAEFEKKYFGDSPPLSLCVADTDRVKEYVFEAARIPEVRGASALLEKLNETEIACDVFNEQFGAPEQWIIYRGGGSLLAIVPASLRGSLQAAIEEYYPQRTLTATITAVTDAIPLKDICINLGDRVDKLSHYLDIRKRQKLNIPHFQMLPYVEQCQLCGIRPGYIHYSSKETDVPEKRLVCDACLRKRKAQNKSVVSGWLREYLNENDSLKQAYIRDLGIDEITWCNDLSEIGSTSNGYIAIIYGDGDDVGKVRKQLSSLKEFSEFAEGLKKTTRHIAFRNLATYTKPVKLSQSRHNAEYYHPFETITLGGDDLCIIMPARGAIEMAANMMREFAQAAQKERWLREPLQRLEHKHWGMSIGALICPDHFPIYYIYELVQELLKSAKQQMRKAVWKEDANAVESYINFLILKGTAIPRTGLENLLKDLYETQSRSMYEEKQILTERPYPLSRFETLLQYARRLKNEGLPPTQLHAIARVLYEEREQATFDLMMRLRRMPQSCANVLRELFCDETLFPENQRFLFPWRQNADKENEYSTVLLDIFELMEFLH